MIYLTTDSLRVEIALPEECPNDRTRFARAGFVSDVTVNGSQHFCASEPRNLIHPSSGGRGLCCEYMADFSGEVSEGEWYPKLGIGLIQKNGPYSFSATYDRVKPFPITVEASPEKVIFTTEPISCLGYAVKEIRTIEVIGNTVRMACSLKNVGEREIATKEYCHNFLSIDGMAISPDYRLEMPSLHLEPGRLENQYPTVCNFLTEESGVCLEKAELEVSLADVPMANFDGQRPFRWTLSHKGARAKVFGQDDVKVDSILLWATDHIISPEIIQNIRLQPGEETAWSRTWTFICD